MTFSVRSLTATVVLSLSTMVSAQAQEALEGEWEGAMDAGPMVLNVVMELHQEEQVLDGVMISVDQGNARIPIDEIGDNDGLYTFIMHSVGARYVARLVDDELMGTFYQNSAALSLNLTRRQD